MGVGGNKLLFSWAGLNLNMHVALAGKEKPLPYWEVCKALFLFFGKLKYIRKHIYGAGGLLQKKLDRAV